MSSEQAYPGSDLRSAARDYQRDAEHKAKYAFGVTFTQGRGEANPRPTKTSEVHNFRRTERSAAATSAIAGKAKLSRKQDMLAAGEEYAASSSEESGGASGDSDTNDNEPMIPTEVLYGFDSPRVPSHGSQILNTALAKAIEQYEDKETIKLVRNEYEFLDADDEDAHNLGHVSRKPRNLDAEDAEYEFV